MNALSKTQNFLLLLLFAASFGVVYHARIPVAHASSSFHVSGMQLPASLTSPTSIEKITLSTSVTVDMLVIANTDASNDHTVTVSDCQSTPFLFFNAYTIPHGQTWVVNMAGTRFQSCFKWSASSTTVMGTVTGSK